MISHVGPKRDRTINSLLTRLVCSRWLYTGLVLFYIFIDLNFILVNKKCKKKDLANIQVRSVGKQVSCVLPRVLMLSGLLGKQNSRSDVKCIIETERKETTNHGKKFYLCAMKTWKHKLFNTHIYNDKRIWTVWSWYWNIHWSSTFQMNCNISREKDDSDDCGNRQAEKNCQEEIQDPEK